jgi:hypothetical protein
MECDPGASKDVVNIAFPLASVPVPKTTAPSFKVTVPVGVPLPGATTATVAVNVTVWPKCDGFGEEVSVVVVAALLTVWVRAGETLVL